MQYGQVIAQDDFQRANVTGGWGTSTDGNSWSQLQGSASDLSVSSNEGTVVNATWDQMALGSARVQDAEILVRMATNLWNGGGPCLRIVNSTNFIHFRFQTSPNQVFFRVQVSGTNHDYGAVSFTFTSGAFYWWRCRVQDNNLYLKVWADGTTEPVKWTTTATMTSSGWIQAAGQVGMMINDTGAKVDHFKAIYTPSYRPFVDANPQLWQFALEAGATTSGGATVQGAIDFGHAHALALTPGGLIAGALNLQHNQALGLIPSPQIAGAIDFGHEQGLSLSPGGLIAGTLNLSHEQSLDFSPGALKQGSLDLGQQQALAFAPTMQASDSLAMQHQNGLSLTPGALIQGRLDLVHSHGLAPTWRLAASVVNSASASAAQSGPRASVTQGGAGASAGQGGAAATVLQK